MSSGGGEGWFIIAGSLYDKSQTIPFANGTITLTNEPLGGGSVLNIIEVDGNGNFYTTESINFGNGLYVEVYGPNGEQKFMNAKVTDGACNSCHGNSIDHIWIE